MSQARTCPTCGTQLPADAPAGVCPLCLLKAGMADSRLETSDDATIVADSELHTDARQFPSTEHSRQNNSTAPVIGTKVTYFGDYELLDEIARGGMGVVYRARQVRLNRIVALKMILAGQFAGATDIQRFYSEAEAAAKLDHPGIVPIFEVGEHDGRHFFSMGFVEGESLASRIAERPLAPRNATEVVRNIAQAIQYAHDQGVIHRDLKPANILLGQEGQTHVTDFGLAKCMQGDNQLTATGQILGTPSYMPPEQAAGRMTEVRASADVYSLGAILYATLTGHPPFQADNPLDTVVQVLERDPVAIRQLNPAVPRDLETICLKCLQKDPAKRYQSAAALSDDLGRWLRGEPIVARPVGRAERAAKLIRRHPIVAGLAAAVALALIGGTIVSSFFAVRAQQSVRAERVARADAEEKRRLAETNEQLALEEGQRAERNAVAERQAREVAQRNLYLADMRLAQEAWQTGHLLRLRELLDRHVPQQGQRDLRGWEWWLMHTAWQRLSLVLDGERWCAAVAWSPDDRYVATGHVSPHFNAEVHIWDASTGQRIHTLSTGSRGAFGVAWSPDGQRLATSVADGSIVIWQASEGTELRRWKAHEGEARISGWFPCWSVDWHPDGRQLATSGRDGLVKIWNPDTNAQIHEFAGHSGDVHCVAWSPDGRQLASAGADHWVRVWDLSAVETVGAAKSSSATVVVQRHSARIWSLAWSPDGERLATASDDGSVRVWETQAGQPSSQPVLTLRQQRDTRGFWAWKGSTETPLVGLGHDSFVNAVVWSPDGRRIVSGGEDQTVRVWDARSGRELETLRPHRGSVESLAFSRDGMRLASAGKEGSLAIFEMQREPAAVILSESAGDVQRLCWSPDGSRLLTGHHDLWAEPNYEALVWDVEKRQLLRRLSPLTAFPGTVGWSRLGNQVLLLESDSRLTFLDPNTGSKVGTFDAAGRRIYATDYDPQGYKLAIAVGEGWIYVLDAASRNVLNEYRPHRGAIADLAWSPDGRWIAAGSADAQVTVTDSETGELRWRLSGHTDDVRSITWSPDGQRLASGSDDRTIRIWDVQAGEQLQMLRGHSEAVKNVAWHPNGNRLASAAFDGMIKLWDTELWREILSLRAHVQGIVENSLQWSPDGRRLASGSLDRTIIIWQAAGIAAAESERRDRPMLKLAWRVLGLGGSLDLGDDVVSNLAALPQGEFAIRGISFPPGTEFASRDLAEIGVVESLRLLDLQQSAVTEVDLQALSELSHLQQIDLRETRVSQAELDRLRESLPQTTILWEDFASDRQAAEHVLELGGSIRLRAAGQEADISQASELPPHPFRVLVVDWKDRGNVQDEDLRPLAELSELTKLDLFGTSVSDEGLQHLRELTKIEWLNIGKTQVNGTGLAHLAKLEGLHTFKCLWSPPFTNEGLSHMPAWPNLKHWEGDLAPPVTDEALVYFQRLPALEKLLIWRSNFTGEGFSHLSDIGSLKNIGLNSDKLENRHLAALQDISHLQTLHLANVRNLDAVGVQHLADIATLEHLSLRSGNVDDDGLLILAQHDKLVYLDVEQTNVTAAGIAAFKERRPQCKVVWDEQEATRRAAADAQRTLALKRLQEEPLHPHEVRRFWGHTGPIKCVAVSSDGSLAASVGGWPAGDGTLRLWNLQTGKLLHTFRVAEAYALAVAFTPDCKRVISGGDRMLRVWDVETRELLREFASADRTEGIAALPDNQRIIVANMDGVSLWNIETGERLRDYGGIATGGRQLDVALSGDGRRLISADEKRAIHVWDVESGNEIVHITDLAAAVESAALNIDGTQAAVAMRQRTGMIYPLDNPTQPLTMEGHRNEVVWVRYSSAGDRVVTASRDNSARVWDAKTGEPIVTLLGHVGIVWSAVFTPDGQRIVSGGGGIVVDGKLQAGSDHSLRLWALSSDNPVDDESPPDSTGNQPPNNLPNSERATPAEPSDLPQSSSELPADHVIAILQQEPFQRHLGLTDAQRAVVKPVIVEYLTRIAEPERKSTAVEISDQLAEPLHKALNESQRSELTRLQRFIKFVSPMVSRLQREWMLEELKLTPEQPAELAHLQAESLLRVYSLAQERQTAKIEASYAEAIARERTVLTDKQQQRFDQLFLQQQTWLHGPAVLIADVPQLAPLELTPGQRTELEEFVKRWRSELAKPASLTELIAKRQAGLHQALDLLNETQQASWPAMIGEPVDWKPHFGISANSGAAR